MRIRNGMKPVADFIIGFCRAFYLCLLAVLFPKKFITVVESYKEKPSSPKDKHSVFIVRRAFWFSLLLMLIFGGVGYATGYVWGQLVGCVNLHTITFIQIAGALFLLWGTLFVRGWEITTWSGVTAVEKVNRWIYRSLCCIGTAIIVFSLALSPCLK
jgi:hypothetical protein